jgi:hypothetical protein
MLVVMTLSSNTLLIDVGKYLKTVFLTVYQEALAFIIARTFHIAKFW